jgi:two-component system response regulator FlrC
MLPETTLDAETSSEEAFERHRFALLWVFPEIHHYPLEPGKGPWRIGRGADCEMHIEDHRASRHHATIAFKGPVVSIEDLRSTNGTFVDGAPIVRVPVKAGSIVRIGERVGVFCSAPAAPDVDGWFREPLPGYYVGPLLQRILDPVGRAAVSDLPILIVGETGTGKERVAQFSHQRRGRTGRFHAINCATIPPEVAESQLFGHRQGAFTGAQYANIGHFRAADGGTLFLDEVAELPTAVQAKLLRALQERAVIPLGDTKALPVDVRIVAACAKPLIDSAEGQPLRRELLARLTGLTVELPPLAARKEEIAFLFMSLLRRFAGADLPQVDGKLVERLCLYSWPRNVRELEFLVRQLLVLHGHRGSLKRAHLPAAVRDAGIALPRDESGARRCELESLARALEKSRGNVSRASANLGISRARAYRLLAGEPIAKFVGKYCRGEPA